MIDASGMLFVYASLAELASMYEDTSPRWIGEIEANTHQVSHCRWSIPLGVGICKSDGDPYVMKSLIIFVGTSERAKAPVLPCRQVNFVSHSSTLLIIFTGWLSAIGWQVYLAGVCFMVAGLIQALIALNDESYVPQRWHQTLLTIAVISSSIFFNSVLAVRLPLIEGT